MSMLAKATVENLYDIAENGKAEIVNGEFVLMSPTGAKSGRAGGEIYFSLRLHEEAFAHGYAFPDNVGFVVNLSNRDSFSPDAAWYVGYVEGMDFVQGAPAFAAEVRSKNDYGHQAERAIAQKIRDYFSAGTQVVWDVDLLSDIVIKKYTASNPENPILFRRGEIADAEPAVNGWKLAVDKLFIQK